MLWTTTPFCSRKPSLSVKPSWSGKPSCRCAAQWVASPVMLSTLGSTKRGCLWHPWNRHFLPGARGAGVREAVSIVYTCFVCVQYREVPTETTTTRDKIERIHYVQACCSSAFTSCYIRERDRAVCNRRYISKYRVVWSCSAFSLPFTLSRFRRYGKCKFPPHFKTTFIPECGCKRGLPERTTSALFPKLLCGRTYVTPVRLGRQNFTPSRLQYRTREPARRSLRSLPIDHSSDLRFSTAGMILQRAPPACCSGGLFRRKV